MAMRANSYPYPSMVELEREDGRQPSPVDGLFTATQRRLLARLYGEPDRAFYVRELMAHTGGGGGATHRGLLRLERAGLIRATRVGARKFVQASPQSPIHDELASLVHKTVGLVEPLRHALCGLVDSQALVFVFQAHAAYMSDNRRDLGLAIVSDLSASSAIAGIHACDLAEALLGRFIFPLHLRTTELGDAGSAHIRAAARAWLRGEAARIAGDG